MPVKPTLSNAFTLVLVAQFIYSCAGSSTSHINETGLVWEKSPDAANYHPWASALNSCANRITGGRMGWRLPSVHEMSSLVDPSIPNPGPRLPQSHPFVTVQSNLYWAATGRSEDSAVAWGVNFLEGTAAGDGKPSSHLAWCVRSAGPLDSYYLSSERP